MYSFLQRLRSLRHLFWYGVSERVRWSRGTVRETPALRLAGLTAEQTQRIAALRSRYQVQFELRMNQATALNNYEYLDLLDRAWSAAAATPPSGGVLCDVGCASFWYAATLQAFFAPKRITGVEVEGHRLFRDGHARIDYASGYLADFPDASFVVLDYRDHEMPADVITAWFPFVTPAAILAWRLPLTLLEPRELFARVARNLNAGGLFVMVNHGSREAALAADYCSAAGLRRRSYFSAPGLLSKHRAKPAILSTWTAA